MGGYDTMSAWDRIQIFETGQDICKRDSVLDDETVFVDEYRELSMSNLSPSPPSTPPMAPSFQQTTIGWSPSLAPRSLSFKDPPPAPTTALLQPFGRFRSSSSPVANLRTRKERNRLARQLYDAACTGDLDELKQLLDSGAPVNEGVVIQGLYESFKPAKAGLLSPLAGAAGTGHLDSVELLVLYGADINPPMNQSSCSPLHQACRNNDCEMAQLLLDLGADVNLDNGYMTTPIMYAARYGSVELVETIISYKADMDRLSFIKTAAIHWAVWTGKVEVVEALLKGGARPSHSMGDGTTPLHCAATGGHFAVARVLLEYGADPRRKNESYQTPLQLAEEAGHDDIAALLKGVIAG